MQPRRARRVPRVRHRPETNEKHRRAAAGVLAYVVLHHSPIEGIAASHPRRSGGVISGVSDKKLEYCGDELIALVNTDRTGSRSNLPAKRNPPRRKKHAYCLALTLTL